MDTFRYKSYSRFSSRVRAIKDLATYPLRKILMPARDLPTPELVKRNILRSYLKRYSLRVFVETGTYLGDTVAFLRPNCAAIYSIEIQERFYVPAKRRFEGDSRIQILHGDSRATLREIVPQLREPALFWLDGHFPSGETEAGEVACPVLNELAIITSGPQSHVILIDDAREFDGTDYPAIDQIEECARQRGMNFELAADIMRLTPAR